jgi:adenine-specific DNA-methyltransferase
MPTYSSESAILAMKEVAESPTVKGCDKLAINQADNEFDVVYINGDHNIPTVLTQMLGEGGPTRMFKLRPIEPKVLARMASVEDV